MSIPTTIQAETEKPRKNKDARNYNGSFMTSNDERYDALYVAIDSDPRINHRAFSDDIIHCYVFLDEKKEGVIRFNRTKNAIDWTLAADDFVKEKLLGVN